MTILKDIQYLNSLVPVRSKYNAEVKNVVKLDEERTIQTLREAENTISLLSSRGKQNNIKGLERIEKHIVTETTTGKLVRLNERRKEIQNYFIKGKVNTTSKYSKTRSGNTKTYDKSSHDVNHLTEL